ncbi:MAG TPA: L,D-transpeptidase [Pseudonocardiaceae bacterium]
MRLLAVLGVLPVVLMAAACGGSGEGDGAQAPVAPPEPVAQQELLQLPEASTFGNIPELAKDPEPQAKTDGLVVHPHRELPIYREKNGPAVARLPVTQLGSPTWVPVIAKDGDWYQVLLPSRPNGSTGWIHASTGDLEEARTDYLVEVDVDAFTMTVREGDRELGRWTVGVGKPEYPTPRGRTFIMASIEETVANYSPYVLPLGTHSESHETYGGGPGTVALHGWPDDSPFGKADSDGCIRVPDDALDLLITLPLGTLVLIR